MVLKDFWEGFPDQADTSAVDLILYFSEEAAGPGRQLQEMLNNTLPDVRLELFTDFEELVTALKRPEAEPAVIVLVISNPTEMEAFLILRPAMQKAEVILVLTDESAENVGLAQRLNPRYISMAGEDFVDLATVIDAILQERRISSTGGQTIPPKYTL
jgi:DNA-binding NarL/FixJ family response regulator